MIITGTTSPYQEVDSVCIIFQTTNVNYIPRMPELDHIAEYRRAQARMSAKIARMIPVPIRGHQVTHRGSAAQYLPRDNC